MSGANASPTGRSHQEIHGGRVLEFARERRLDFRDVLDFSASINPLGPSPLVLERMREALERVRVYPDEFGGRLVGRLSEVLSVPRETILAGNGATDLLYFWTRTIRPRRAALLVPTFVECRKALESVGADVVPVQMEPDCRLPLITTDVDVVMLTNPNNPSGVYARPEQILDWISSLPQRAHVFVDEAFVEFTGQPSLASAIRSHAKLWILRSMTKFYAIPGLRLGYLIGSGVDALRPYREPWQVNVLAEVAGLAALDDVQHAEQSLKLVQRERLWIWKQLRELPAIRSFPTNANYFLARCGNDEALGRLQADLKAENALIRDCRGIEGLSGPYFRFAVRTRPENELLLAHLRRL